MTEERTSLRKVVCVVCGSIFKVDEDPPRELLADAGYYADGRPADPYSLSELRLNDSVEAMDYCQRTCAYCKRGSPFSSGFQTEF